MPWRSWYAGRWPAPTPSATCRWTSRSATARRGTKPATEDARPRACAALAATDPGALFHGPGWAPRAEFVADVDAFTSQDQWILDHDYAAARHLVWSRLDTLVWLDYPRVSCEARVIRRSLARGLLRPELWNGNRESVLAMVLDAEHPVRWSWTHHARKRAEFEARTAEPANAHVRVVRLRRPRDARAWLASLPL